jgi:hypothetical protein
MIFSLSSPTLPGWEPRLWLVVNKTRYNHNNSWLLFSFFFFFFHFLKEYMHCGVLHSDVSFLIDAGCWISTRTSRLRNKNETFIVSFCQSWTWLIGQYYQQYSSRTARVWSTQPCQWLTANLSLRSTVMRRNNKKNNRKLMWKN